MDLFPGALGRNGRELNLPSYASSDASAGQALRLGVDGVEAVVSICRGEPRIFSRGVPEQKFSYIVASRVQNINLS